MLHFFWMDACSMATIWPLRGCLLVATDEEGRWPEDHDGRGGELY
jgi:hypothetical protein